MAATKQSKAQYEKEYAARTTPVCEHCGSKISKLFSRNGFMLCKKCDAKEAERIIAVPDRFSEYREALRKHMLG